MEKEILRIKVRLFRKACNRWNMGNVECAEIFDKYEVDEYIQQLYEIFHVQGDEAKSKLIVVNKGLKKLIDLDVNSGYITAVAIDSSGKRCAFATVSSKNAKMITTINLYVKNASRNCNTQKIFYILIDFTNNKSHFLKNML